LSGGDHGHIYLEAGTNACGLFNYVLYLEPLQVFSEVQRQATIQKIDDDKWKRKNSFAQDKEKLSQDVDTLRALRQRGQSVPGMTDASVDDWIKMDDDDRAADSKKSTDAATAKAAAMNGQFADSARGNGGIGGMFERKRTEPAVPPTPGPASNKLSRPAIRPLVQEGPPPTAAFGRKLVRRTA
jgi:hypothetical protein